jgi:hypothetical protein
MTMVDLNLGGAKKEEEEKEGREIFNSLEIRTHDLQIILKLF